MYETRKFVTSLLLLALLFTGACTKKKPPLPQQAQAPTIPDPLAQEIPEKPEPPLEAQEKTPPPPEPASKSKQKKPAKGTNKKSNPPASTTVAAAAPPPAPAPAQTAPSQNTTQPVATLHPQHASPEPAPEMTVAAAISSDKAKQQKEDTARMVDAAENALKGLTRQLNDEEKGMRTQIETYLQQSRKATTDGDYERAYKLAEKAQVLAAALTKQ
jgi:hypothetical protein